MLSLASASRSLVSGGASNPARTLSSDEPFEGALCAVPRPMIGLSSNEQPACARATAHTACATSRGDWNLRALQGARPAHASSGRTITRPHRNLEARAFPRVPWACIPLPPPCGDARRAAPQGLGRVCCSTQRGRFCRATAAAVTGEQRASSTREQASLELLEESVMPWCFYFAYFF